MSINDIKSLDVTDIQVDSYLPDAEKIVKGTPHQNVWNAFSSRDEKFHAGVWDAQAGAWTVSYDEDEFCYILEGESIIHDESGQSKTVKAGDTFTIPAGFSGTWEVPKYCKKIYVIYEA